MPREIVTLPRRLMRQMQVTWAIDWRGQVSPDFTSGVSQTVGFGFPRWTGAPSLRLRRDMLREWRAISGALRGRARVLRVPMVDPLGFDPSEAGATPADLSTGVSFDDGTRFDGGAGWAFDSFALASGAASRGDTALRVDVASCAGVAPKAGQIMSADDWPFVVTSVRPAGGTLYDLTVEMPLRADIADGAVVLMEGVGRFEAVEEGMGAVAYGRSQTGDVTLSLQEVLNR